MDTSSLIESIADEMDRADAASGIPIIARTDRIAQIAAMLGTLERAGEIDRHFAGTPEQFKRISGATAPQRAPDVLGRLRRVLATLVHDSWATRGAVAGFRGSGHDRRLEFAGEGVRIDLGVSASPARPGNANDPGEVDVLGRIESEFALRFVCFTDSDGGQWRAPIDDSTFFELRVPASAYRVEFSGEGCEVAIDRVVLERIERA